MACNYAGISTQTFANWSACVRDGNTAMSFYQEKCRLLDDIAAAKGGSAVRRLTSIELQTRDLLHNESGELIRRADWRAAAWLMERIYPNEYGLRERITYDIAPSEGSAPIRERYDLSAIPDDQLAQLAGILESAAAPDVATMQNVGEQT